MTYLPSLFKKIDTFYRQAMSFTKKAERDYFEELNAIAGSVGDPGLARQLRMLAELYRYALSMGGGYATIARGINALKEMYGDEEESDIDSILNGMLAVLAKEAGGVQALAGRDNPRFLERLSQLKADIESRPEENDETYENYQDEVNVSGATGESEGELGEYGLGGDTETVAPAQLGFGNKEDPKANRGWHTTGPSQPYKNWKEHFANEVNAYNVQLSQTHDPDVAKSLDALIKLIPQLSELVEAETELSNQLKVAPDDKGSEKLASIRAEIKKFRGQISGLKKSIRSHQLSNQANELSAQLEEAVRKNDYKQKELLEQKLALNNLSQSNDVYKAKERNLRLRLIESMSGGNFPGKETLEKEKSKINLANQERVRKEVYDREITEERGRQQKREVTPTYEPTRGGGRVPMEKLSPEKQIDLEKASFSALVYQFQIDIASAAQAARQAIYEMKQANKGSKGVKKQVNAEYKAIIDEISEAIRKKDRPALYAAQTKLVDAIKRGVAVDKIYIQGYANVIRLEPHFRKVLENIKEVTKNPKGTKQDPNPPKKLDESGELIPANFTEEDKETWKFILNDINRLRVLYRKYYMDMDKQKDKLRFERVIRDMGRLEDYLKSERKGLEVRRPEHTTRYRERSPLLQEIGEQQDKEFQKKLLEKGLKQSSINHRMQLLNSYAANTMMDMELANQKRELNHLTQSTDVGKNKERNLRLQLIQDISGGNFPNQDELQKIKQEIHLAKQERISKRDYDRRKTEQKGFEHGKGNIPVRSPQRGGWGPGEEQYKIKNTPIFKGDPTLIGFADLFGQSISTAVNSARQEVYLIKRGGDPSLKPYIDNVSAAIRKKDNLAKYDAIKTLKEAIYSSEKLHEAMRTLEKSIRLELFFRDILGRAKSIASGHKITEGFITETTNKAERVLNLYRTQDKLVKMPFTQTALLLGRLIHHLKNPGTDIRLSDPAPYDNWTSKKTLPVEEVVAPIEKKTVMPSTNRMIPFKGISESPESIAWRMQRRRGK